MKTIRHNSRNINAYQIHKKIYYNIFKYANTRTHRTSTPIQVLLAKHNYYGVFSEKSGKHAYISVLENMSQGLY